MHVIPKLRIREGNNNLAFEEKKKHETWSNLKTPLIKNNQNVAYNSMCLEGRNKGRDGLGANKKLNLRSCSKTEERNRICAIREAEDCLI